MEYFEGYYSCLDSVARERIYLAGIKARPIESTREFVLNNIENNYPHFIAVKDKQVVGWCDIIPMRGMDFAHSGTLGMGVHKEYRNLGIGSALLDTTLEAAKKYGLERIELEVYTSNTIALKMYEKYGFTLEGVKHNARKLDGKYFDIQVMALFFNR
jgi:ribosomal protein S18 acetylase RimI-like enzyme